MSSHSAPEPHAAGETPPMVRLEGLSLRFGGRVALEGLSLSVGRGELFGLLGPNGSGKSTLLRVLATLLRASGGRAEVDGLDVSAHAAAVRRRLGVVFQASSLDDKLTVTENLRLHGHLYGLAGADLRERVAGALERFGLGERARDRAETLSGGLRRRVELAQALLHRPAALLLDEPTTGLDPAARQAFWESLAALRAGHGPTILLATHLMDEAERCERVALLDGGRLVALDSPLALKHALGEALVTVETADPEGLARRLAGLPEVEARVADGVLRLSGAGAAALAPRLLADHPGEVEAVRVGRPTLGDVFMARTGHGFSAPQPDAPGETQ